MLILKVPLWLPKFRTCSLLKWYNSEEVCVKQTHWDCSGWSVVVEKNCLASKPGSWPSVLLRKELREHSSHLHLQPLRPYLVRSKICQKADTSSDYAMTFPAWWKSTSLPTHLNPWKEDSWRQPSAREIDALCLLWNGLLPDLPLRWFPVWNVLQLAAVQAHKDCIPHELLC